MRSRLFCHFAMIEFLFVRGAAVAWRTNLLISHLVRGGGGWGGVGEVEVGESQGEINIDSFLFHFRTSFFTQKKKEKKKKTNLTALRKWTVAGRAAALLD